jgi:hypothetical protein
LRPFGDVDVALEAPPDGGGLPLRTFLFTDGARSARLFLVDVADFVVWLPMGRPPKSV